MGLRPPGLMLQGSPSGRLARSVARHGHLDFKGGPKELGGRLPKNLRPPEPFKQKKQAHTQTPPPSQSFELEFGSDLRWAYTANEHADRTAGKVSKWLDARHNLRTWGDIFRTSDDRCWKVLRFLTTRAKLLLQAPRRPKTFGPRVATGAEFLAHLSQLHPQHSWQHFPGAVFSRCTLCGLKVHGSRRGRGLALLPCCRTTMDWVGLGVHPSHELDFRGQAKGWQCRYCRLVIRLHGGESSWQRLARVCRKS